MGFARGPSSPRPLTRASGRRPVMGPERALRRREPPRVSWPGAGGGHAAEATSERPLPSLARRCQAGSPPRVMAAARPGGHAQNALGPGPIVERFGPDASTEDRTQNVTQHIKHIKHIEVVMCHCQNTQSRMLANFQSAEITQLDAIIHSRTENIDYVQQDLQPPLNNNATEPECQLCCESKAKQYNNERCFKICVGFRAEHDYYYSKTPTKKASSNTNAQDTSMPVQIRALSAPFRPKHRTTPTPHYGSRDRHSGFRAGQARNPEKLLRRLSRQRLGPTRRCQPNLTHPRAESGKP